MKIHAKTRKKRRREKWVFDFVFGKLGKTGKK
jgi:hypothetical protein